MHTVYNESILLEAGLRPGDTLTGLSFRLNGTNTAPIWTVDDYQIRLATSLNSAGFLDDVFANNRGDDYTVVRSGELSYDGTEYETDGAGPHPFGEELTFDTTFTYNGGDLLLEYTHSFIDTDNNEPGVQEVSRADFFTDLEDANGLLAQTFFGQGFDAQERFFNASNGRATVVRFTVAVPEPGSAALLLGIGMIGVLRRRKM